MTTLTLTTVQKVYVGRKEGCRCGCLGKYFYPTWNLQVAQNHLGRVNNKKVEEVIAVLNSHPEERDPAVCGGAIYNYQDADGHVFTAYLKVEQ